jgi:hypothetical protein
MKKTVFEENSESLSTIRLLLPFEKKDLVYKLTVAELDSLYILYKTKLEDLSEYITKKVEKKVEGR